MNPIGNDDIRQLLENRFPGARINVEGDGYKYRVTVISEMFAGLSKVKRHQHVYAVLNGAIASGALHAVTIQALAPDEDENGSGQTRR